MSKLQTKMKVYRTIERVFPIWALKRQANVIYRAFDGELAKASNKPSEVVSIESSRHFEVSEFRDKIRAIKSRRLMEKADNYYIYLPELVWEQGSCGGIDTWIHLPFHNCTMP